MRKEIGDNENEKHWTLVRIRELNGKNAITSIWSFKRKRALDVRLIKHKSCLFPHDGMQIWVLNYWETYPTVVNWMSLRAMLSLSILRELHTNSVNIFFLTPRLM